MRQFLVVLTSKSHLCIHANRKTAHSGGTITVSLLSLPCWDETLGNTDLTIREWILKFNSGGEVISCIQNIHLIMFSAIISLQMLHAWPLTTTTALIKVKKEPSLGRTAATADHFTPYLIYPPHLPSSPPNTDCIKFPLIWAPWFKDLLELSVGFSSITSGKRP